MVGASVTFKALLTITALISVSCAIPIKIATKSTSSVERIPNLRQYAPNLSLSQILAGTSRPEISGGFRSDKNAVQQNIDPRSIPKSSFYKVVESWMLNFTGISGVQNSDEWSQARKHMGAKGELPAVPYKPTAGYSMWETRG